VPYASNHGVADADRVVESKMRDVEQDADEVVEMDM